MLKTERHTVHGYQARWAKIKARCTMTPTGWCLVMRKVRDDFIVFLIVHNLHQMINWIVGV